MALPGVAARVGAVAHVVAAEVDEQAVVALALEARGDAAVAGGAGAHADLRALAQVAGDVGADGVADVLAEEHVVGVAGGLAARVARDDIKARHLDIVGIAHEDAAALVVLSVEVAVVAGDGAALKAVVVVVDIDAAAVLPGGVAGDDAVDDLRPLLAKPYAAAVSRRVVILNVDALDKAFVGRLRNAAGRDSATRISWFKCLVVRYRASLVAGLEVEVRAVEADSASRVQGDVLVNGRIVLEIDVDVLGLVDIDAAAALHRIVLADLGAVHVDGRRVVAVYVDASATEVRSIVLNGGIVLHIYRAFVFDVDASPQTTTIFVVGVVVSCNGNAVEGQVRPGIQADAAAVKFIAARDQTARDQLQGHPFPFEVYEAHVGELGGGLARHEGEARVLVEADDAAGAVSRNPMAVHVDGERLAVGDVHGAGGPPVREHNERVALAVRGGFGGVPVRVVRLLARGVLDVGDAVVRTCDRGEEHGRRERHGQQEAHSENEAGDARTKCLVRGAVLRSLGMRRLHEALLTLLAAFQPL